MRKAGKITLGVIGIVVVIVAGFAGYAAWIYYGWKQVAVTGGPLEPAQAAYDVRHYALSVALHPEQQTLDGQNVISVLVRKPLDTFKVQLDDHLTVKSVAVDGKDTEFTHQDGMIGVPLASAWQAGSRHRVTVAYGGSPYVAPRPPWLGGMTWAQTPDGEPWLGVTTENAGGDLWWPCKDAPSDEPDEGMTIDLTLPDSLVGIANGRKTGETHNADGTITSHWTVHYPINNYDVTFYAAPYVPINTPYHGVDGGKLETITFWALPSDARKARKMWTSEAAKILRVLGKRFGEYPFLKDKYAVVEAPYLGMEHQSAVAYGDKFKDNKYGFDAILLHETAHEWWGNKITARDWADYWLHESFATYSEAIYVNDTLGEDKYLEYVHHNCRQVKNAAPIVQGDNLTAEQAYNPDIYNKGACMLNTLRWLLGDDTFFGAIREFQDQYAYQLTSTEDFTHVVEHAAGKNLDWFWKRYLFTAAEPVYSMHRTPGKDTDRVTLQWDDPEFTMPLPVAVNGKTRRVAMPNGKAEIDVPHGAGLAVDPSGWVLAKPKPE